MGSSNHMYMFTHVQPYSSTMIRDPNVLCYHLCNLSRWDTHGNHQGHHAPWRHQMGPKYLQQEIMRYNGIWYFNAIKKHHDAELTRKEITRQFRHYKTTSLYLPLTLMAKHKKSCPHKFGDHQETGRWEPHHWTGSFENSTRPADSSMRHLCIIKNENAHDSTEENGNAKT